MLLEMNGKMTFRDNNRVDTYLVTADKSRILDIVKFAGVLRKHDILVDFDTMDRSVKAQLKYANKINARTVIVLGGDELDSAACKIKNMETGEETSVNLGDIETIRNVTKGFIWRK